MSFADVKNRTYIELFSDTDKATILAVMQNAYEASSTARGMFDNWISDPEHKIFFIFKEGKSETHHDNDNDQRKVNIDLNHANSLLYIDNNGTAQGGVARVILHELVHALTTPILEDDWNVIDYKGEAVEF